MVPPNPQAENPTPSDAVASEKAMQTPVEQTAQETWQETWQVAWQQRWWPFIQERFSPLPHLLLISSFWLGNGLIAVLFANQLPAWLGVLFSGPVLLLFFFRMRLMDELKDLDDDRFLHPERPLVRGLVTETEARCAIWGLYAVEALLCCLTGWVGLLAWALAAGYSFLMWQEFYARDWLRPQMEWYAVSHTLVAVGLGLLVMQCWLGEPFWQLSPPVFLLAASNWLVFNVFEFARKTYGVDEEPTHGQSYSARLQPVGAAVVTQINALLAILAGCLLLLSLQRFLAAACWALLMLSLTVGLSVGYVLAPEAQWAVWYRRGMHGFIPLYYGLLSVGSLL
ncbi:MAG: hypothetical protein SFZ03_09255 [Candidatus Melainabacteria bacterium]|nr:hypothetical protein [Candidatus Melainabacteria bacterium]